MWPWGNQSKELVAPITFFIKAIASVRVRRKGALKSMSEWLNYSLLFTALGFIGYSN